jgi:hypothetical protein
VHTVHCGYLAFGMGDWGIGKGRIEWDSDKTGTGSTSDKCTRTRATSVWVRPRRELRGETRETRDRDIYGEGKVAL